MTPLSHLPVTVVIPAFNRASVLPRALASIAAQRTYQPSEVIVVDDGSTDSTADVARELGARVIGHEVNLGSGVARNTGFWASDSPWIMQLNSDDEWFPHCLETLWALRDGHVLVSGASIGEWPDGTPWYNGTPRRRPRVLRSPAALAFPDNIVASSGVLLRSACIRAVGGYRTDLRYAEDLELWLRMLELGSALVTPVPVSRYHRYSGQVTADKTALHGGHLRVLDLSVDRAWWRHALTVKWSAIPLWDEFRSLLAERKYESSVLHALRIAARPSRMQGLARALLHRMLCRRRGSRLTLDAMPTVAALPGASVAADAVAVDLRGYSELRAVVHLLRRPTNSAVAGRRWHIPVLRLLGVSVARGQITHSSAEPDGVRDNDGAAPQRPLRSARGG